MSIIKFDFNKLFNELFRNKISNPYFQFFRYFISSLIAMIVDYIIYLILTRLFNFYYLYANTISRYSGMVVNYIINVIWVFDKKRFDKGVSGRIIEILLYFGFGSIGVLVNNFFIWLLTDILKIFDVISKFLSMLISYLFSFILRKVVLFKK